MKINKLIIFSLILLVGLTFIGSISAQDSDNVTLSSEIDDIIEINDNEEILDDSCCEDETGPKTWTVEPDLENPNQVQKPTVQPVIDAANPGDTIVLNGTFVHCHFMINKTLNIIATPGTSVGVCPHHTHMMKYGTGPKENGIFYISPEANGTVLSGFRFTNDFYYIANNVYNPFGVYVDADDVVLENLTFDWVGSGQQNSKFNPDDFLFDAIILNYSKNATIRNILLGNVNAFIKSVNATNINTANVSMVEKKVKELISTAIVVSDLNVEVSDNGNLKITLKDVNNNPISNREVNIILDGQSRSSTTDNNGIINLNVKYSTSGTHYVALVFAGDDEFKSSFSTVKITVNKKASSIAAPKKTLKVKKVKIIKISLKSGNNAISGKKITLKVNGKIFSAKTNAKGVASIKVKVAKKGTFKYTVKFAGDSTYKSVTKTGKLAVKK